MIFRSETFVDGGVRFGDDRTCFDLERVGVVREGRLISDRMEGGVVYRPNKLERGATGERSFELSYCRFSRCVDFPLLGVKISRGVVVGEEFCRFSRCVGFPVLGVKISHGVVVGEEWLEEEKGLRIVGDEELGMGNEERGRGDNGFFGESFVETCVREDEPDVVEDAEQGRESVGERASGVADGCIGVAD